ncbi:MAG TPA: type II toxin-antitoxin system prevent-host-death family antitoxin [Ottowia sp.]|nr:type II toxin-antitoxin system prevent-host-death family antitoxin [Ottowia sp.]
MTQVSVAEAKNHLSELLVRVQAGEELYVTRHGRPVARLVAAEMPEGAASQKLRVQQAFEQLRAIRGGLQLEGDLKTLARQGLD